MVSNLQIFVVAVPVLVILGSDSQSSFFVRCVVIWMNDLVVLLLIFGNLMRSMHDGDCEQNKSEMISSAIKSFRERRRSRTSGDSTGRDDHSSLGLTREWGNSSSNGRLEQANAVHPRSPIIVEVPRMPSVPSSSS